MPSFRNSASFLQKSQSGFLRIGLFVLIFLLTSASIFFLIKFFKNDPSDRAKVPSNKSVRLTPPQINTGLSSPKVLFSVKDIDSHEYYLYSFNFDSSNPRLIAFPGVDIEARRKAYQENFDRHISQSDSLDDLFNYPSSPRAVLSSDQKSVAIAYAGKLGIFPSDLLQNPKMIFEIDKSTANGDPTKWDFDHFIWSQDDKKLAVIISNEFEIVQREDEAFRARIFIIDSENFSKTLVKEFTNKDDEVSLWGFDSRANQFLIRRVPAFDPKPNRNIPRADTSSLELVNASTLELVRRMNNMPFSTFLMDDRHISGNFSSIIYDEGSGSVVEQNIQTGEKRSLFKHSDSYYVGSLLSPDAETLYGTTHPKGDINNFTVVAHSLGRNADKMLYQGRDVPYQNLREISPDGKYLFVESLAHAVKKKLAVYDLQNAKLLVFDPKPKISTLDFSDDDIEFVGWVQ